LPSTAATARTAKAATPTIPAHSEYDERKKGWKRCECPIFASGTLDRIARRQNTGQWEWEPSRLVAAKWETFGNWDATAETSLPVPVLATEQTPGRTKLADATEAFLATCQNRGIATPTLKRYGTFIKQLNAYCNSRGYTTINQLTITDMDRFYASWKDGKRAKAKKLEFSANGAGQTRCNNLTASRGANPRKRA
jgi:hypothetical protein